MERVCPLTLPKGRAPGAESCDPDSVGSQAQNTDRGAGWPLLFRNVTRSLYFFPSAVSLASVLLAIGLVYVGRWTRADEFIGQFWWTDLESARTFLATSAGGLISITGVSFSVLVVALTLASNQFCPRALRRFVEDRVNRVIFGLLVGNTAYALVLLTLLKEGGDGLPALALSGALVYGGATALTFIYFIHYTATGLQVDSVVRGIRDKTIAEIEKLKTKDGGLRCLGPVGSHPHRRQPEEPMSNAYRLQKVGFVQAVDLEGLLELSRTLGEPLKAVVGLGDFVTRDTPCVEPLSSQPSEEDLECLRDCFEVDYSRLLESDISYGFREIVDIALKAVSPALNDPTTAVMCVQNLSGMFEELCRDGWPATSVQAEDAAVLFTDNHPADFLGLIVDQIALHSANNPIVLEALLKLLLHVHGKLEGRAWGELVRSKGDQIVENARAAELSPYWLDRLEQERQHLKA